MVKMTNLPIGELAIWQNTKGTYFLFYIYEHRPKELWMKLVWSSSGNYGNDWGISPINKEWMCEPLGITVFNDRGVIV